MPDVSSLSDLFPLSAFEVPRWLVEPMVGALRGFNTVLDTAFYDVPDLVSDLAARDVTVRAMQGHDDELPSRLIDLEAATNPEGSLLLIDATTAPYVHRFESVKVYLDSPHPETREVTVVSVTGVGSSAYGSAAFGWQISRCLGRPVLAIVPGYGLADMIQQGMGGWFAFGLHDALQVKPVVQDVLTAIVPENARIGRALPQTIPDHPAPTFQHGSGSSDVLHTLLSTPGFAFDTLVGHSKGALVIKNAIRSLPAGRTPKSVVTLGCPVRKEIKGVAYHQFLGAFDMLGQLNSWGNLPDHWLPSMHTTNPYQLLPLPVCELLRGL